MTRRFLTAQRTKQITFTVGGRITVSFSYNSMEVPRYFSYDDPTIIWGGNGTTTNITSLPAKCITCWQLYKKSIFIFLNGPIPASFIFRLFNTVTRKNVQYKFCRWLDSYYGPLDSEATALPTESQPLPTRGQSLWCSIGCDLQKQYYIFYSGATSYT